MSTLLLLYALYPATLADCDREWKRYGLAKAHYAVVVSQPKIIKLPDGRRALGFQSQCYRARSRPVLS
jgi:hypothetical protein